MSDVVWHDRTKIKGHRRLASSNYIDTENIIYMKSESMKIYLILLTFMRTPAPAPDVGRLVCRSAMRDGFFVLVLEFSMWVLFLFSLSYSLPRSLQSR